MIKTIYSIGKILKENEEYQDYFEAYANPNSSGKEMKVILAIFENQQFKGIELEDFSKKNLDKYLYRKPAGSNGFPILPTLPLYVDKKAEENAKNYTKFFDKIGRSLKNSSVLKSYLPPSYLGKDGIDLMSNNFITALKDKDLQAGTYLFSIQFVVEGENKYLGEIQACKELLTTDAYNKYFATKTAKFIGKNKICAITYQPSEVVWGKVDTLGFTVNDEAFIRGGFDANQAYKMFPVSPDAVKIIEGASRIIFEKMKSSFYGLFYVVLPRFLSEDVAYQEIVINNLLNNTQKEKQTMGSQMGLIDRNERIILEILEEDSLSSQNVYYDIFFYEQPQAQFLIKLHVSDLLPSRFAEIYKVKNHLEMMYNPLTQKTIRVKGKKEDTTISFNISFGTFLPFFSRKDAKGKVTFQAYFFKLIEAVFYKSQLNEQQVLKAFVADITKKFKNSQDADWEFTQTVKEAFVLYEFLYQLELFSNQRTVMTNQETYVAISPCDFVAQHQHFFDDKAKEAAFYLGCMVEMLLKKQQAKIGSQVFKKYLNGMNIDSQQLRKIYLKWTDKVNQYNDTFRKSEWEEIERYGVTVNSGLMSSSKASKTDLSFAFATGLVIQKEYAKSRQKGQTQKEEEETLTLPLS